MPEPYPSSYYAATRNSFEPFDTLQGDCRVDVGIVGGGFTGIATALSLVEKGYRVAVVEANRIGWGASGRNGGQFTDSVSGEHHIRRALGADEAKGFLQMLRWRGHEIIEDRVQRYGISCDLRHGHLMAAFKSRQMHELQESHAEFVEQGMADAVRLLDKPELEELLGTEVYCGGLLNERNGHLHPLNLCLGEADAARRQGVRIFEESPVTNIEHGERPVIVTAAGRVIADQVIVAGNAYHRLERSALHGMLFPATSHIVVTEPLPSEVIEATNPRNLAVYDCNHVLDYYRMTADGRLLFGAGCNYSGRDPDDIDRVMRPRIMRVFPQLEGFRIDYRWSGKIGIVINRVPQLGRIDDNIYYAQGYSGHGICLSHVVGEIMADAVSGTMERFDVFSRIRHYRVPVNEWIGSRMIALGMLYYRLRDLL